MASSTFNWYIHKNFNDQSLSSDKLIVKCLQAIQNDNGDMLERYLGTNGKIDCDAKIQKQGAFYSLIEESVKAQASTCGMNTIFILLST